MQYKRCVIKKETRNKKITIIQKIIRKKEKTTKQKWCLIKWTTPSSRRNDLPLAERNALFGAQIPIELVGAAGACSASCASKQFNLTNGWGELRLAAGANHNYIQLGEIICLDWSNSFNKYSKINNHNKKNGQSFFQFQHLPMCPATDCQPAVGRDRSKRGSH